MRELLCCIRCLFTHAPQQEIDRLTDFNLSCFTSFNKCKWLGDLLSIAWDWRLYSYFEPGHTLQMEVPTAPRPCDILSGVGRDTIPSLLFKLYQPFSGKIGWTA